MLYGAPCARPFPPARSSPSASTSTERLHLRRPPRHPRPQRRRHDHRGPAVPRVTACATRPSRSCCSRTPIARASRRTSRCTTRRAAGARLRASPTVLKEIAIDKGDLARGFAAPTSSSRAPIAPAHRSSSTSSPTASSPCPARRDDGGITVYGSMQCPYYVVRALRVLLGPAARQGARRADRPPAAASAARRSIRRCSPATPRCWRARRAGRSRWSTSATKTSSPPPSAIRRSSATAPASTKDGTILAHRHRPAPRRRRLRHAQPGRAVARRHPRHRPLSRRARCASAAAS